MESKSLGGEFATGQPDGGQGECSTVQEGQGEGGRVHLLLRAQVAEIRALKQAITSLHLFAFLHLQHMLILCLAIARSPTDVRAHLIVAVPCLFILLFHHGATSFSLSVCSNSRRVSPT
jgi:hypothetical protein